MAEIFQFIPKKELNATANLEGFISGCRDALTVLGADLDWESNEWDVTKFIELRGQKSRTLFVFSNYQTAGRGGETTMAMAQPFLDFAKSYMRYQHLWRKTKSFNFRLGALRALERSLVELSADGVPRVEQTNPHVLNHAVELLKKRNTSSSLYNAVNQLKTIGELLVEYRFVNVPFSWRNPIKKPDNHLIRVGKEAEQRRSEKLPSQESLEALARAYNLAVDPVDVLVTSMVALMLCAPTRINELFRLPADCEHEVEYDGENRFGLRWWASKGAGPDIKWIVSPMVDLAKEALARIREVTREARRMALWYEKRENAGKLYLPKGFEHLRGNARITSKELTQLLGLAEDAWGGRGGTSWARQVGLVGQKVSRSKGGPGGRPMLSFSFQDVERAIVEMLPRDFPVYDIETGLKYSEALLLIPKNFFKPGWSNHPCMFEPMTTQAFNGELGSKFEQGKSSIFSRMNLVDSDGKPFRLTSHQFRHWLNTQAHKKRIDDATLALWSGRKDETQNAYYDHISDDEMLKLLREGDTSALSGVNIEIPPSIPMTREEFLELQYQTVHTTPYGFCVHNWTTLPCQKQRACLDCTEHFCIKGDAEKTERIRQVLEDAETQLKRDQEAVEEGGWRTADRWYEHNLKRVARLRNLLQIFDDPTVPMSTMVRLTNENEHSDIKVAMRQRVALGDSDGKRLGNTQAARSLKAA